MNIGEYWSFKCIKGSLPSDTVPSEWFSEGFAESSVPEWTRITVAQGLASKCSC